MKLRQSFTNYSIDPDAVPPRIEQINKVIHELEQLSSYCIRNLNIYRNQFTSPSMDKAEEHLKEVVKKLNESETEIEELLKSVQQYRDNMKNTWKRQWNI